MSHVQRTYCSATVGVHEGGTWDGFPKPCGSLANGPHPDPALSYRQPLCNRHLAEVEAAMAPDPLADEALEVEVYDLSLQAAHNASSPVSSAPPEGPHQ